MDADKHGLGETRISRIAANFLGNDPVELIRKSGTQEGEELPRRGANKAKS
jgi:hypothetical protein